MWLSRLVLTGFRNHAHLSLALGPRPVVLAGPNGAGKTNVLEAVSLLAAGQGLRRAPYDELARIGGAGGWAVAATVETAHGAVDIGTGLEATRAGVASPRPGRIVRIGGETQAGSGALAGLVEVLWLVPAMDGLFTGPAGDRRRFLDRLVLTFDAGHGSRYNQFERAMRQRNRLLEDGVRDRARFDGLERIMAETGAAIAAARVATVAGLTASIAARRDRDPASPFPWAGVILEGSLETDIAAGRAAIDAEDAYQQRLAAGRERDRAAGRTLDGPHRADLVVGHGPKAMPAASSSTGEQKALLVGLVLAHAEMLAGRHGAAPMLLLDEIAAHLDVRRRAALFGELLRLGSQAWLTGTDPVAFAALEGAAQFVPVSEGAVESAAFPRPD